MPALRVSVEMVSVDHGLWCHTCALPSGIRVWYVTQTGPAMSLRMHLCCDEGGCEHLVEPTEG